MNIKLKLDFARFALLTIAAIGATAQAVQPEAPFTYATRYNLAGQVTGTIAPDPDEAGGLRLLATRNHYNSLGLLDKVESGQLTSWADETIPADSWGGYGFSGLNVFSTTEITYDNYGRKAQELMRGQDATPEALVQYSYDNENFVRCKAVRMNRANFLTPPPDPCVPGTEGSQGPDRIFRYTNNIFGQVTQEERAVGTPLQQIYATTTYTMRAPTSYTDANGYKTDLQYNHFGRLFRRFYPLPTTPGSSNTYDFNQYEYDANGNLTKETKRSGATITYTIDALNRATLKDLSDNSKGSDVAYEYDARGRTLSTFFVNNSTIGVFNQFDGFGRLKQANNVSAVGTTTESRVLQYTYDANSNRTQIKHPDNTVFNYFFDGLNRVVCASEGGDCGSTDAGKLVNVVYRSDGRRGQLTRAGGATTNYTFDNAGRLASFGQVFAGSADNLTNNFSYNPASQIAQLTFVNAAYSPSGDFNRSGAYNVNGLNQYTSVNGSPVLYDTNGNLTSDAGPGSSFTYDMENRLVAMTSPAGGLVYDPLGRLTEYTAPPAATIQFLYDGNALVGEYTVSGNSSTLAKRYVHGDRADEPWVQYNGSAVGSSTRRYLHADHLGSIVAQSSSSGAILGAKLTYDAFGIPGSSNYDRFGYTGQLWLKELGLGYYKARIYHPKLGRFLQTDSIFYADDMNMYAYVANDPTNHTDPTGNKGCAGMLTTNAHGGGCTNDRASYAHDSSQEGRSAGTTTRSGTAAERRGALLKKTDESLEAVSSAGDMTEAALHTSSMLSKAEDKVASKVLGEAAEKISTKNEIVGAIDVGVKVARGQNTEAMNSAAGFVGGGALGYSAGALGLGGGPAGLLAIGTGIALSEQGIGTAIHDSPSVIGSNPDATRALNTDLMGSSPFPVGF